MDSWHEGEKHKNNTQQNERKSARSSWVNDYKGGAETKPRVQEEKKKFFNQLDGDENTSGGKINKTKREMEMKQ